MSTFAAQPTVSPFKRMKIILITIIVLLAVSCNNKDKEIEIKYYTDTGSAWPSTMEYNIIKISKSNYTPKYIANIVAKRHSNDASNFIYIKDVVISNTTAILYTSDKETEYWGCRTGSSGAMSILLEFVANLTEIKKIDSVYVTDDGIHLVGGLYKRESNYIIQDSSKIKIGKIIK